MENKAPLLSSTKEILGNYAITISLNKEIQI